MSKEYWHQDNIPCGAIDFETTARFNPTSGVAFVRINFGGEASKKKEQALLEILADWLKAENLQAAMSAAFVEEVNQIPVTGSNIDLALNASKLELRDLSIDISLESPTRDAVKSLDTKIKTALRGVLGNVLMQEIVKGVDISAAPSISTPDTGIKSPAAHVDVQAASGQEILSRSLK